MTRKSSTTTTTVVELGEMANTQSTMGACSPPPKETNKPGWRFYAAFGCLCIINLVCALDATSLSVALPTIANKLDGTAIEAFWSGTSFLLTSTVFQPSFASLSHIFGRKPMILLALTFFTAGAILSALAHNFTVLLVGRSIQGVGGGGIIALTYVIVTDLVTLRDRGKWFGLISMMWAIGSVTGPVVGGVLAEKASWRWIFWINLPFCGIAFVVIPIFLQLHYKVGSLAEKLKQIDWVGTVIFVASVTSFLIPITWGGIMYDWNSWRTLVPLLVGLGGILTFVAYSKILRINRGHDPLIRGSIFKSPTALASFLGATLQGTILWSLLYYLPLYYEAAKHLSPTMAGVGLFPQTLTVAPASVVVGILIAKMGKYRWSVWSGWVLTTTGMGLLILLSPNTSTVGWIFLNLVSGLGLGILYPAISFSVQASASNADLPFAAAMYSFFRAFGQMLGVAIGGAVFQNEIKKKLLGYPELAPMATEYSRDSSALVQIIKGMPASQDLTKTHLIQAYVDSLRVVWIVMCALAGLALISSLLWVKDLSLERELETEQGFRHEVKVTDSELTLGNSVATTREKKLLANDSQMTLGNSSVTSEPSSVMERTIVWKPSEATLGNSSTRTETTPEPKDLVKKPSQMTLGASSTTTIPADTDRDTHITAAAPAVDTKDFTDVHIPRGSGNPQTPQKVKKPRKPKKPSLKQQRDELLDWLYND